MWDGGESGLDADDTFHEMQFSDTSVRHGFIKKVYGILTCQLLVTLAIMAPFALSDGMKSFAANNSALFFVCMIVGFACIIAISCCENVRRSYPTNLIVLGVFTVAEGGMLGLIAASVQFQELVLAVGITFVLVLALSVFALQTRWDFTGAAPYMIVVLLGLMIFGFVAMFTSSSVVHTLYAAIGAIVFGCYLVLDTQLMMGGKHKYAISPEEYIFATLALYLDIINMFLFILQLISSRN